MRQRLITVREVSEYGRPISRHMDECLLDSLIRETEDQDIRPVIGDDLYAYIQENMDDKNVRLFLDGGKDEGEGGDDTCGSSSKNRCFCGLKAAIAYYVEAKLIKVNDGQITRFGLVEKEEQYSNKPVASSKNSLYNDYAHIADNYLAECKTWLEVNKELFPVALRTREIRANRTTYRVIGD